ncbi:MULTISPECIES: DUF979 domain-containing protein [Bacillus]|jgi:uncharacterized membrane protein|uniref:DUF979 domain-containing protein n=1 Tax=Bacillus TaxID=1386 RepID=UPI00065E0A2F|nr:DUF979 domain-containing protein [Bacillus smithii]AKP45961.1 Membrane protein [Bacillus smithii]MED4883832.1 DUF979 domain-containing protein [Bacillus smithii]MED4927645.1 DUF979 domain-containing protein [Bacillus smithii]
MILSLEYLYVLMGVIGLCCSIYTFLDKKNTKRVTSGLFYFIYAVTLLLGKVIPPFYIGLLVILMVLIVGFGGLEKGKYDSTSEEEREAKRKRLGNWLFLPALLIPFLTVIFSKALAGIKIGELFLFDPSNPTLVGLGVACVIAMMVALALTKSTPKTAIKESRRLLEAIGWAVVLPQFLATLGTIFDKAGVGNVVADIVKHMIPSNSLFWSVVVLCVGMAFFTMIMGNAFAAFPVMAGGIIIPILIQQFGADPNQIAAISMFAGYCGTLMTPMAANFNIVPAALLDLKDKYHVIRVQVPTALLTLLLNIVLMYCLARWQM